MTAIDQHYTPDWLADRLAAILPGDADRAIDLAAGGGSLLEAVDRRMQGRTKLAGVDIDRRAVALLRREHPRWVVSHANSLDPNSYRSSTAFRSGPAGFDAVILNPPFSYRGGTRTDVEFAGRSYRVTPATAFLAHATAWLRPTSVIVAVVPENVMNIRGDAELWRCWSELFSVESVDVLDRNTFPGAHTTTAIVRLDLGGAPIEELKNRRALRHRSPDLSSFGGACNCVQIVRGRVPVHRAANVSDGQGVPFVHTTHLRDGSVCPPERWIDHALASAGPFVLLPRIGTPRSDKIAIAEFEQVVLSDCVYGLRPADANAVGALSKLLRDNFADLAKQYAGSCARYLTVDRLVEWLRLHGLTPRHVRANEWASCECSSPVVHALA